MKPKTKQTTTRLKHDDTTTTDTTRTTVSVRMKPSVIHAVKAQAKQQDRSFSWMVEALCRQGLEDA